MSLKSFLQVTAVVLVGAFAHEVGAHQAKPYDEVPGSYVRDKSVFNFSVGKPPHGWFKGIAGDLGIGGKKHWNETVHGRKLVILHDDAEIWYNPEDRDQMILADCWNRLVPFEEEMREAPPPPDQPAPPPPPPQQSGNFDASIFVSIAAQIVPNIIEQPAYCQPTIMFVERCRPHCQPVCTPPPICHRPPCPTPCPSMAPTPCPPGTSPRVDNPYAGPGVANPPPPGTPVYDSNGNVVGSVGPNGEGPGGRGSSMMSASRQTSSQNSTGVQATAQNQNLASAPNLGRAGRQSRNAQVTNAARANVNSLTEWKNQFRQTNTGNGTTKIGNSIATTTSSSKTTSLDTSQREGRFNRAGSVNGSDSSRFAGNSGAWRQDSASTGRDFGNAGRGNASVSGFSRGAGRQFGNVDRGFARRPALNGGGGQRFSGGQHFGGGGRGGRR